MTEVIQNESEDETNGQSSKGKVKFENAMPREEAVSYFQAILDGLKQGKLHFKQGDKTLAVTPADHLTIEVKASRKGLREKVSFELSWEHSEAQALEITSGD